MRKLLGVIGLTFCSLQSFADTSLYDVKVNDVRIYDKFVKAGAPKAAVERVFEFLDINAGKTVKVDAKVRGKDKTYMETRTLQIKESYAAIIDYSLPSTEKRLYVLNLKTGDVSKHLVAHGKGSGVNMAAKFSNIGESKMTSLGLYLAGDTYIGKHGQSMNLYGLEASNNKAARRDIVMHSAKYVSEDFAKSQGRLGRSWGCPAVAPAVISKMITTFHDGGVIYAYHKDITAQTLKNPNLQVVTVPQDGADVDLPGEEETLRSGEAEAEPLTDDQISDLLGKLTNIPWPLSRPEEEPVYIINGIAIPQPRPSTETAPIAGAIEPVTVEEVIAAEQANMAEEIAPVESEEPTISK